MCAKVGHTSNMRDRTRLVGVSLSKVLYLGIKVMKMYFSQVLVRIDGCSGLSEMDAIEVCDGYVRRWGTHQI